MSMSAAIHEGMRAGWRLWQRRPRLANPKETLFAAGMATYTNDVARTYAGKGGVRVSLWLSDRLTPTSPMSVVAPGCVKTRLGMAATVIYSTITPPERYFGK
jgi:hypothetical protein